MCVFQSMKSVDNGIARYDSHNDLVRTVGDFSLPYLTHTFDSTKETQGIFLCITYYQHSERYMTWTDIEKSSKWGSHRSFCQLKPLLKTHGACAMQEKCVATSTPSNSSISIIKRCRTCIWHPTSSNKYMYWIYKHLESSASGSSRLFKSVNICP